VGEERWYDGTKWTRDVRGPGHGNGEREASAARTLERESADASRRYRHDQPTPTPRRPAADFPLSVERIVGEHLQVVPSNHKPCSNRDVLAARERVGSISLFGAQLVRVACSDGVWFLRRPHPASRGFRIESGDRQLVGSYSPRRWLPGGTISLSDGTEVELRRALRGWTLRRPDTNHRLLEIHLAGAGSAQNLTVTFRSLRGDTTHLDLIVLASCAVVLLLAARMA
jgi:hypothetical protein